MFDFKGMRFPIEVILVCIRGYAAYPPSYRHIEETMEERGVSVDRSSIPRYCKVSHITRYMAMRTNERRRVV